MIIAAFQTNWSQRLGLPSIIPETLLRVSNQEVVLRQLPPPRPSHFLRSPNLIGSVRFLQRTWQDTFLWRLSTLGRSSSLIRCWSSCTLLAIFWWLFCRVRNLSLCFLGKVNPPPDWWLLLLMPWLLGLVIIL